MQRVSRQAGSLLSSSSMVPTHLVQLSSATGCDQHDAKGGGVEQ
jgi:hypothetical protein